MKKSPLSRFPGTENNYNNSSRGGHGRWRSNRNMKYSYNSYNNSNDCCDQSFNNSEGSPSFKNHITGSFQTSTPTFRGKRGNWNKTNDRQSSGLQDIPNSYGISPYNQYKYQNSFYKKNRRQNNQRDYREMNISAMFNIHEILRDPWADLEKQLNEHNSINVIEDSVQVIDTSVEILDESSVQSSKSSGSYISDNDTINISSSIDEGKRKNESSIDLPIETIDFGSSSQDSSSLINSNVSHSNSSETKSSEDSLEVSQSDSVIEISCT